MSVTYAQRKATKKRATENDKTRTLKEQYVIKVDNIADDQPEILNSSFAGVPKVGDAHPTDSSVTVKDRDLEPTESRLVWLMNVTFSDEVSSVDTGGGGGGGLEALKVTIGKWDESFILEVDLSNDKKQIRNSAGDRIKYESTRPQIMITISTQTQDPSFQKFQGLQGTVNGDPVNWLGFKFKKNQMLYDEYRAVSIGNNTWAEDHIFKIRQAPKLEGSRSGGGAFGGRDWGWQPYLLDAGFNELIDVDGVKTLMPIKAQQVEGDPRPKRAVTQEWPLDGGVHIPADDIDGNQQWLSFQTYDENNFNGAFHFDFSTILTRNEQKELGLR
jgi:hypothetical protein